MRRLVTRSAGEICCNTWERNSSARCMSDRAVAVLSLLRGTHSTELLSWGERKALGCRTACKVPLGNVPHASHLPCEVSLQSSSKSEKCLLCVMGHARCL